MNAPLQRYTRVWPCPRPWTAFSVNSESGEVFACCWAKTSLGWINDLNLLELWNGEPVQRLRRDLSEGKYGKHCSEFCPVLKRRNDIDSYYLFARSPVGLTRAQLRNRQMAREYFLRRESVVQSTPLQVRTFPTNRCGMSCVMCSIWTHTPKRDTDFLQYLRPFLDGALILEVVGGEPLLSERWLDFIREPPAELEGLRFKMITNGKFLTKELIAGSFPAPHRWEWIGVSMDAATQATLESIRSGMTLEELQGGLARLVTYSRGEFPVGVLVTVLRQNVKELGQIAEWFLRAYPAQDRVRMSFSLVRGDWHDSGRFTSDELDSILGFVDRYRGLQRLEALDVLGEIVAEQYPRLGPAVSVADTRRSSLCEREPPQASASAHRAALPVLQWHLTHECNLECGYCYRTAFPRERASPAFRMGVEDLSGTILKSWSSGHVVIAGGEPLLLPSLPDLAATLSRTHQVSIQTNLSSAADVARLCAGVNGPALSFVDCALHPLEMAQRSGGLRAFIELLVDLLSHGFPAFASVVLHPSVVSEVEGIAAELVAAGVALQVKPFWGEDGGVSYPEAYGEQELVLLEQFPTSRMLPLRRFELEGHACATGDALVEIDWYGDVFRCLTARQQGHSLGNIFDPGGVISPTSGSCPYERCECTFQAWTCSDIRFSREIDPMC